MVERNDRPSLGYVAWFTREITIYYPLPTNYYLLPTTYYLRADNLNKSQSNFVRLYLLHYQERKALNWGVFFD